MELRSWKIQSILLHGDFLHWILQVLPELPATTASSASIGGHQERTNEQHASSANEECSKTTDNVTSGNPQEVTAQREFQRNAGRHLQKNSTTEARMEERLREEIALRKQQVRISRTLTDHYFGKWGNVSDSLSAGCNMLCTR
jgi:hypothetical protein